jgi:hypothetical protein
MSEETKAVVPYTDDDAKFLGLPTPGAMNYLEKFCQKLAGTPLCPPSLAKGNPAANMVAVALTGREMGLGLMQSIRGMFVVNSRIGMEGSLMMAVMRNHGVTFTWHEHSAQGCKVTGKRKDTGEEFTAQFTADDKKTAGLDSEPWKKYPRDMCRHRCEGQLFRALASDYGGSSVYEVSELQDMDYEVAAPATESTPEVQVEPEKPATAGRRPKADKPIDVKPEPAADKAQPEITPAASAAALDKIEPGPIEFQSTPDKQATNATNIPPPSRKFYVISSASTLPELSKVEIGPLEKLNIAVKITTDLPEAMKVSDSLTRDNTAGITHYVLTFKEDGKASILHTSKATPAPKKEAPKPTPAQTATVDPTPRMYVVLAETVARTVTTIAELESLSSSPHPDISTMGIMAQAEANKYGVPYLVMYKKDGQYHLAEKFNPPTGAQPAATLSTEAPTPEDQAMRERLTSKLKELKANVPTTVKFADRPGIIYAYVTAYMGIADIKEFRSHLDLGEQALIACEKDLLANPVEFVANAVEWGKRARAAVAVPATTPQMNNGEIAAMAKYYQERGWNGPVTSLAEQYRRSVKPDPVEFQKMLEFSGVKILPSKDAEAFFLVMLTYDKETNKKFAMGMDGSEYGATLTKIRDRFDGADLKDIPAVKFADALEQILSGTEPEPNLFGN